MVIAVSQHTSDYALVFNRLSWSEVTLSLDLCMSPLVFVVDALSSLTPTSLFLLLLFVMLQNQSGSTSV